MLLGTVTGIGGGTLRDVLLDIHPILWVEQPAYLAACIGISVLLFFTAHLVHSRYQLILWFDAIGLALFATVGAERAIATGAAPLVAVVMGVVTASFGGIIRDVLSQQRSIIFSREIYVTAAMAAALAYVVLDSWGAPREAAIIAGIVRGSSFGRARSAGAGRCRDTIRGRPDRRTTKKPDPSRRFRPALEIVGKGARDRF